MRAAFDALGPWLNESPVAQDAEPDAPAALAGQRRFRAVFISDLHLGTPGCQADALLDFLKHHPSDHLYLVGDIVDGWQLRRRWFWPQAHNDVVQKLLRRARKGCRVVFVPGNHDEFARAFVGHSFGGIEVVSDAVHTTADGRSLWVTHGDHFDGVIQCAKWLAYVGDNLYEFTLKLNRHLNTWRARMGLPYWSLSAYLKGKVKKALDTSLFASVFGGLFSAVLLLLCASLITKLVANFTSVEYFSLGIMGISLIAGVSGSSLPKSLISGMIGLLMACVGMDAVTGVTR